MSAIATTAEIDAATEHAAHQIQRVLTLDARWIILPNDVCTKLNVHRGYTPITYDALMRLLDVLVDPRTCTCADARAIARCGAVNTCGVAHECELYGNDRVFTNVNDRDGRSYTRKYWAIGDIVVERRA